MSTDSRNGAADVSGPSYADLGDAGPARPFLERVARLGLRLPLHLRHAPSGVEVDLGAYRVLRGGVDAGLTARQVELLALFVGAPDRVWTREELHRACWDDAAVSRRVDVQLTRIRTRLGLDLFRNVRDRGWSLRVLAA